MEKKAVVKKVSATRQKVAKKGEGVKREKSAASRVRSKEPK